MIEQIEGDWQKAIVAVRREYRLLSDTLDKRYRRVTRLLLAFGVGLIVAVSLGFTAFRNVLREQNAQRRDAIRSACIERRQNALAIRGFVATVSPELKKKVEAGFPVEPDCNTYTDRILKKR